MSCKTRTPDTAHEFICTFNYSLNFTYNRAIFYFQDPRSSNLETRQLPVGIQRHPASIAISQCLDNSGQWILQVNQRL